MNSFRNWMHRPDLSPVSFILDCKSINLDTGTFISADNQVIKPTKHNPNWSADYSLLFHAWYNCVSPQTKQTMNLDHLREVHKEWVYFKKYHLRRARDVDYINYRRTRDQALDLTRDE